MGKILHESNIMITTMITGAGRGIGLSIAQKFYNEGHNLVLLVRDNKQKKQLEKKLEDVKWKDDLCYASISHMKGIPIEEHLSTTEEENKDKLVKQIDLFNSEDLKPKDINWVPEDFR